MSQITPAEGSDHTGDPQAHPPGDAGPPPPEAPRRRPTALIVAIVVAVAVIAALVGALVWARDDGDDTATEPTTTLAPTTAAPTTAAPTTAPPTTTAPAPVDTSTAVFPVAGTDVRFDDPVDAARAFAVDFVGFTDPVVGEFAQGDARSGEVAVRPTTDGPVTTVLVRQLGSDGTWWVLGSATADITVDAPGAGEAVTAPLTVRGTALAFEGVVNVEVREDGVRQPLGTGTVTGGGDIPRPFSGEIDFSAPTQPYGAVLFLTRSEQDGQVWQAAVLRVGFA